MKVKHKAEPVDESPNRLFDSSQTAGTITRGKFPKFPMQVKFEKKKEKEKIGRASCRERVCT